MSPQVHEHCREHDGDPREHCDDHSGMMAWIKGTAALMTLSAGLLSYSVIWQAPSIRIDIAKEIARLDAKDKDATFEILNIKRDVTDIGRRVSVLENKEP